MTDKPLPKQYDFRIFSLSADLICIAGIDGFFKLVNASFTKVLGYTEAELLARPFIEFVHPEDVENTRRHADRLTQGPDAPQRLENRYRCADGSYRWLEWRSQAAQADGLIYAVARDVTEQKATARKLLDYARELERSNVELQEFAYVASHDLQEPLRAVAGCIQMLAQRHAGKLDQESTELINFAVDGAKRMQALINDLLTYSRVGTKGINRHDVDATSVVEKALKQLSFSIEQRQAVIQLDPLPTVWADPSQLTQLFQNLIANAIKFCVNRAPDIRVWAEQGNGETVFAVSDNGIGIEPQYRDRLFRLFQRLHSRSEFPGSGIGLAICRKIIERHDGRIWIDSQPGVGSTFRFSLPGKKS